MSDQGQTQEPNVQEQPQEVISEQAQELNSQEQPRDAFQQEQPQEQPGGYPNAYPQPPQQYYYGGYYPPRPVNYPGKDKAIPALVCGIVSVAFGVIFNWFLSVIPVVGIFTCFIGVTLGVVSLVMSISARKMVPPGVGGMATAALVLGIVGIVFSAIQLFTCGIGMTCAMCTINRTVNSIYDYSYLF